MELDNAIKEYRQDFFKACGAMTAEQIKDACPFLEPQGNIQWEESKYIGHFPVDEYLKDKKAVMDAAKWCCLVKAVCKSDWDALQFLFAVADDVLAKVPKLSDKGGEQ